MSSNGWNPPHPGTILMDAYGTHQPLLLWAALRTTGAILEAGVGHYSTPLLQQFALVQNRKVYSIDCDRPWLSKFDYGIPSHILIHQPAWEELAPPTDCDVVFLDNGPPMDRKTVTRIMLDLPRQPKFFIFHDTEPEHEWEYDYNTVMSWFKYKFTISSHHGAAIPWTTIASNEVDFSHTSLNLLGR